MILIISHSSLESSTEQVYDWLRHLQVDVMRFNGSDLLRHLHFSIAVGDAEPTAFTWHNDHLDISKVTAVWIRRWMDTEDYRKIDLTGEEVKQLAGLPSPQGHETTEEEREASRMLGTLSEQVNVHLEDEFRALSHYFFELFNDKPTLGNKFYAGQDLNKPRQLQLAREAGLTIPDTLITDSKKILQQFVSKYPAIISKNIGDIGFFRYRGKTSATYTGLLTQGQVDELPDHFFPSLFQQAIEKEFEVRTFFLDGELYSMAIFSAADQQTEVDFRRYNRLKPNRTIPFNLPVKQAERVKAFMKRARLKTGSLDFIRSKKGEYIFLEVNPRGQFGMVSYPCNYRLEKKVAEHLIKIAKHGNE